MPGLFNGTRIVSDAVSRSVCFLLFFCLLFLRCVYFINKMILFQAKRHFCVPLGFTGSSFV